MRGRFAPSPTGFMHLGNARTALLAWLQIRRAGGQLVLRIEDLDSGRVRPGAEAALLRDLAWLGLDWDEGPDVGGPHGPYRQSQRLAHYQHALGRLEHYPCACSRREVLEAASAPHGQEPRYPGTCATGIGPTSKPTALRVRVPAGVYRFTDQLAGPQAQDVQAVVGDFVLRRNDGVFSYQLAVVVDDAFMQISHVLRGADLLDSTPRQLFLYQALGYAAPTFCHVPLMQDYNGQRLAKRNGVPSVTALREVGADPQEVVQALAQSLGWDVAQRCSARDLLEYVEC
jgi:glutamyl-tRNA synthetase